MDDHLRHHEGETIEKAESGKRYRSEEDAQREHRKDPERRPEDPVPLAEEPDDPPRPRR